MPKIIFDDTRGIVQEAGSGTDIRNTTKFRGTLILTGSSTIRNPVQNVKTADASLSVGGVYTVSGTSAITLTLPAASTVPGEIFTVRALSTNAAGTVTTNGAAHDLTGSDSARASFYGAGVASSGGIGVGGNGGALAIATTHGSSVTLYCDGFGFAVQAQSGSLAFSAYPAEV